MRTVDEKREPPEEVAERQRVNQRMYEWFYGC
jgi:hypothetical protein